MAKAAIEFLDNTDGGFSMEPTFDPPIQQHQDFTEAQAICLLCCQYVDAFMKAAEGGETPVLPDGKPAPMMLTKMPAGSNGEIWTADKDVKPPIFDPRTSKGVNADGNIEGAEGPEFIL